MSPRALRLSRHRRALQTPGAGSASSAATTTTPLPGHCVSAEISAAIFGRPAQLECAEASGFSFFILSTRPNSDQIRAMCSANVCATTVRVIQRAVPDECQLPFGGAPTYLHRDVLEPVISACGFVADTDSSSSGSSASFVGGRSSDVVPPPEQTTQSAAPSGLTAGPIVALILGAIVCGLLAAFIAAQLKRRRQDRVLRSEEWQSQQHSDGQASVVAPLDEMDDFFSHRSCAEFTAIAMSSKVSSNLSRASTARSSKHSVGSYTDAELAVASSPIEGKMGSFEDPALVMLRVPMSKVHVGELLSLGGYGQVYTGTYDHQLPVAIKKLLPERCLDKRKVELFLGEARLLARLSHERIERLVGVAWDPSEKDPWMLTEYVSGGDLRAMLNRYAAERRLVGFSIEKVQIALHVAEALHYIHSLQAGLLHHDLKSRNVLLTAQGEAVLTSIGCERERDSRPKAGASLWTAPEVIMGERYDEKADVFSYGILLSEIDTHDLPYALARDWEDTVIHEQVWRGELSVTFSERADPDLVALGKACVAVNPRQRPTAQEVFERVSDVMKSYAAFV